MTSVRHAFLAEGVSDLGLTGDDLSHLHNLTNQLARVGQDDDLDLRDGRVHSHQSGHDKGAGLAAAILGLEHVVQIRVLRDVVN